MILVLQVQIAQGKYRNIGVCRIRPHTVAGVQIACLFKVALKSLSSVRAEIVELSLNFLAVLAGRM